ncbi:DUF397 domain-containing protein [Amycolatopsis sp. NPDC026612]|uniref:DUF397 domain-containing protein n=1 Tax=Amycolatopsis sp. NPDC026612 TaxID=3155466 RepID=UPI0033F0604A
MCERFVAPAIAPDGRGLRWLRTSKCSPTSDPKCLEVAFAEKIVRVRDSKSPRGGELRISRAGWTVFVCQLSGSELPPVVRTPHLR